MTRETKATLGLLAFLAFLPLFGSICVKATANVAATVHQSEEY